MIPGGYVPKPLFDKSEAEKLEQVVKPAAKPPARVPGALKLPEPAPAVSTPKKVVVPTAKVFTDPQVAEKPKAKPISPAPLFNASAESDVSPADRLKFKGFDDVEIAKIKAIIGDIQLDDRSFVVTFGQEVNKKLAASVDKVLEFVRDNSFTRQIAEETKGLVALINTDFTKDLDEGGFFGMFKPRRTVADRINDVIGASDKLASSVDQKLDTFIKFMPKLDSMLTDCKRLHNELAMHIAAGKDRISFFSAGKKLRLEERVAGSNMLDAQNARDELDIFETFVKRVQSLEMSLSQNELTLAQIRLTQQTNVKTIETLQNSISNLIPMWKRSLISAITTNDFKEVNKNKDVLSQTICDIISPQKSNDLAAATT